MMMLMLMLKIMMVVINWYDEQRLWLRFQFRFSIQATKSRPQSAWPWLSLTFHSSAASTHRLCGKSRDRI
jgi:hypothetical protein